MSVRVVRKQILILLLLPLIASASDSGFHLDAMEPDLRNQASLQSGARTYLNYCMGCHSLKYQRYLRTATDLGIPQDLMLEHLIFDPNVRIGDLMENSMSVENAKIWFGAAPPDLTLYTQLKGGPEYLYTYLRGFYEDKSRPFGVNNLVFENVGMPHVLVGLQGMQVRTCTGDAAEEKCGNDSQMELVPGTGTLTPEEYDKVVYDLTNFLYYMAEPVRLQRESIGIYVLLFLAVFFVFTFLLGREYTRDIH